MTGKQYKLSNHGTRDLDVGGRTGERCIIKYRTHQFFSENYSFRKSVKAHFIQQYINWLVQEDVTPVCMHWSYIVLALTN